MVISLIQGFEIIMKQTSFSYYFFLCGFKIKISVMHEHCDEQPKTCEEHIRTF